MKYIKWYDDKVADIRVGSQMPAGEGWEEVSQNWKGSIGDKREWFDDKNLIPEAVRIEKGIQKDNRGKVYNINDCTARIITNLDEELKEDETKIAPLVNEPYQKFDKQKNKWVIDTEKKELAEKEKVTAEKRQRLSTIESRLDVIDIRRLRPKEAIADGTATDEDLLNLKRLDDEKASLKIEYGTINELLKSA